MSSTKRGSRETPASTAERAGASIVSWGPSVFTVDALTRMVHAEQLGPLHPVFYRMPVWVDDEGDRAADEAMRAEFTRAGWLERSGRLTGEGLDRLAVLARPETEYAAWFTFRNRTYSTLVGASGGEALVAYRDGDTVELRGLEPNESLSMALMRQLPDRPAARVDALNVRLDAGDHTVDARKLAQLARFKLIGQGEVYVGVRDWQRRYRANTDNPIRFHDYHRLGRVLLTVSPGYLSVAPCSKPVLHHKVEEVHRDLTR